MDSFHSWSWQEVDPSRHTFDRESVKRVVEPLLPQTLAEETEVAELVRLERLLQCELVARFGTWIQGWRWTAREWGGPVQAWEDRYSLLYDQDGELTPPLGRLLGAVQQWQDFLLELADHFGGESATCLEEQLEKAALGLLPLVMRHTQVQDAWYRTFQTVMRWYLEAQVQPYLVYIVNQIWLQAVIGGSFRSWCEPDPLEAADACRQWGREVVRLIQQPEPAQDALSRWLDVRDKPFELALWRERQGQQLLERGRDGHLTYQQEVEGDEALLQALGLSRAWADSGRPLSLEELQGWQRIILGGPAPLRRTRAFAKGGRECYGLPFVEPFLRALEEVHHPQIPLASRAARAYLDLCFFHPFQDGNARSARLLLDALLWREGLTLFVVEPVFCLSRRVEPQASWLLADLVDSLLCQRE